MPSKFCFLGHPPTHPPGSCWGWREPTPAMSVPGREPKGVGKFLLLWQQDSAFCPTSWAQGRQERTPPPTPTSPGLQSQLTLPPGWSRKLVWIVFVPCRGSKLGRNRPASLPEAAASPSSQWDPEEGSCPMSHVSGPSLPTPPSRFWLPVTGSRVGHVPCNSFHAHLTFRGPDTSRLPSAHTGEPKDGLQLSQEMALTHRDPGGITACPTSQGR